MGNAIGSVIGNIGLIHGVTAAIKHVDVHPRALRTPLIAMFGAGLVLFLMTLDLGLSRDRAPCCWRQGSVHEPLARTQTGNVVEAKAIEEGITKTRFAWLETKAGSAAQFAVGAAVVVLGSRLLVDGAVNIAARFGVPSIVVGLTGTSLPELVTAIASSRKSVSDLGVGNVLGANIANLTLIVGVAAAMQDVTMDRQTQLLNFPATLVMMALLLFMLLTERRVTVARALCCLRRTPRILSPWWLTVAVGFG